MDIPIFELLLGFALGGSVVAIVELLKAHNQHKRN